MKYQERQKNEDLYKSLLASGCSELLANCLSRRSLSSAEDQILQLSRLPPARGLKDMEAASQRVVTAIDRAEPIVVVGDYDADGATATATLILGLRRMGAVCRFVVPDRFRLGYGLSKALIEELLEQTRNSNSQPRLLITVDNGINAVEAVAYAKTQGLEVIVTDHHLPGTQLPDCLVVDPHRADCSFPFKTIAGVGLAFYLLIAVRTLLAKTKPEVQPARMDDLLPLVAMGTVADLVKLSPDNRRLVQQGLVRLREALAPQGLLALFEAAGRDASQAVASDFGFAIAPMLNAAGRLTDMTLGIDCLIEPEADRAKAMAEELRALNQARKLMQDEQSGQALAMAELMLNDTPESNLLVVCHPEWHEGIVGLIASRLKERWGVPVFAFAPSREDPKLLKGSGRSVNGIHLRDCLARVDSLEPGLLDRFGGHAMAAGLTLKQSRLEDFSQRLNLAVKELYENAGSLMGQAYILTDGELRAAQLNLNNALELEEQVWGQGFESPIFSNQFQVLHQRPLKDRHLRLRLGLIETAGAPWAGDPLEAIWFNASTRLESRVHLAYRLGINRYRGWPELQLEVVADLSNEQLQ
ncbi:MAG: single-stranded-DNA-specific exonuclease RecJ [Burkholderiaceae bacterium]